MSPRLALSSLLLLLALPGCGLVLGAAPCGPATCAGCCGADGACLDGTAVDSCGWAGNRCDVCVAPQACVQGACAAPAGSGGGTGGGTGGGATGGGTSCQPETNAALCQARAATCGQLVMTDRCGATRTVSCGVCSGFTVCDATHACVCQPETDAQLCLSAGKTCGTQALTDRCGRARTVACGTCGPTSTCGGGGTPGVCGCTPEANATFCARNAFSCGPLTAKDNCGVTRSVTSCGTCVSPNTCSGGTCGCSSESNAQFCARRGASCGVVTGADLCGQTRSVSCGTCSGASTCGGTGTPNQCGCVPEDAATFCANRGKNCGATSGYDQCGSWRVGVDCGTCAGTQTCGGGGSSNVCGCTPESDSAFLVRLGKNCGSVTAPDNCGVTRTVATSTWCSNSYQTCGGGGTANVCGCTAQTDAELCTAGAATCGPLTAFDRCGATRTIASCGTCAAPETCGGGASLKTCGCTSESDATFCARKSATCGSLSGTDHCGRPKAVASCGACGPTSVCGLASANVCGAYLEPFGQVCNPEGWCFEQPLPFAGALNDVAALATGEVWAVGNGFLTLHWDGAAWTGAFDVKRRNLLAVWAAGSEVWAVGDAATVVKRSGSAWVDVTKPGTGAQDLSAVFGFSGTDVWAGGGTQAFHWNGSAWTAYTLPGTVKGFWGATSGDVWAVGTGFVSRWNGTAWTTQTGITWTFFDIHGASATEVWAVASGHVMKWNGSYWADVLNDTCSSVWVGGPKTVTLACQSPTEALKTFDGVGWTSATPASAAWSRQVTGVVGQGPVVTVTTSGTVERRVGTAWVRVAPTQTVTTQAIASVQTFANGDALAFDGNNPLTRRAGVWRVETPAVQFPLSVFGFSATDYLVGSEDSSTHYRPLAYRVTSGVVSSQSLPSYPSGVRYPMLTGLWAASPTDLFGCGETYYNYYSSAYYAYGFFHGDGTSWTVPVTSATNDANGNSDVQLIHGSSLTNVWAADSGATVWRLLAGNWARFTTGSPLVGGVDRIGALWVQSDTKTYLGGNFGTLSFDAATGYGAKKAIPAPSIPALPPPYSGAPAWPHTVRGLRESTVQGFVAVGESGGRGASWKWNGASWDVQSLFDVPLAAVDVDGTTLVAVGKAGRIYRKK